MNSDKKLARR